MANESKGPGSTQAITVAPETQVAGVSPIHLGDTGFTKKDDKFVYLMRNMKGEQVEAPHVNDEIYTKWLAEGHPVKNIVVIPKDEYKA